MMNNWLENYGLNLLNMSGVEHVYHSLPDIDYGEELTLNQNVNSLIEKINSFTSNTQSTEIEHGLILTGSIGSGFLNMNPTSFALIVTVESELANKIVVVANAKEGLINQHSAEKAVKRIIDSLKN